jgi:IS1 family transposase
VTSLPCVEELLGLKERIGGLIRRAEPRRQVGLYLEGLIGGVESENAESRNQRSLKPHKGKKQALDKRGGGGTGGIGSGKTPIVGAVSRKGNVVARVVANVNSATLTAFVREAVSHKVSLLCTDQYPGYNPLDKDYPHVTIDHARGQYVIGAIHTQTIEGFWSIFKRGVVGTFHKMSRKYMPLYVAEFQFRYNNRENADIFGKTIKGC